MDSILQQIEELLKQLTLSTLTSASGTLLVSAKIIAGIGFLIFAYFEGYGQLLGERWDWKKLGAPLAIILGITFYGTFLNITNSLLDTITVSIKNELKLTDDRLYNKLDDYENKSTEIYDKEYEDSIARMVTVQQVEQSSDDDVSFISSVFSGVGTSIKNAITSTIYKILKLIAKLAIMVLLIIRGFFLICLSLFGIFAIAFSIYPPLKGSFSTWLQKYINVYLWLPISYIMEAILLKIHSSSIGGSGIEDVLTELILVLLSLCSIIGFAMVPTISGWFLSASTVSAASKLKSKGQAAGRQAGKAIKSIRRKSVTGGV